ncbi:MFS transporter, partial [Candidatus Saccharibacteria bacterium]|nr:MFS transporter [Candidatus Saccharibacteria bacterium]
AIGISVTMAVFSQKIIPKLGRYALSLGVVLMAVGLLVLQWFIERSGLNTTPWEFIPGLLITGAGMAMIMAPIFAVVLTDVDPKHAGSASGVLSAVQQLGGAIGVALIGVFFFGQLSSSAVASFDEAAPAMKQQLVAAHMPEAQASAILGGAKQCFVDMTHQKDTSETPDSCKKLESPSVPANLPPEAAAQLKAQGEKVATIMQDGVKQANADNFVNAFRTSVVYELCILAVVFVLSFGLPRHIRPEAYQEAA